MYLTGTTIIFGILAYGSSMVKDFFSITPTVVSVPGPQGESIQKATLTGFEKELADAATEHASEAKNYFKAAEHDFEARRYRDAAKNDQKSIGALPTSSAYLNLGASLFYVSDLRQAEGAIHTGLQLTRKKRNKVLEESFLTNLGDVYRLQGKLDEGLKCHQAALELSARIEYPRDQGHAFGGIGDIYREQQRLDEALKSYQAAQKLYEKMAHSRGRSKVLTAIGIIHADRGQRAEAHAAYI